MKSLVLLLLLATSVLTACGPKTCDPQPLPEGYQELAAILPASAVVCGRGEGARIVLVNFSERDVEKLSNETVLKLKTAGWDIDKTSALATGYIVASKGSKSLNVSINNQRGGPNVGRVTGSLSLLDSKR